MTGAHRRLIKIGKSITVVIASVVSIFLLHTYVSNKDFSDFVQQVPSVDYSLSAIPLAAQIDDAINASKPEISPDIDSLSRSGDFHLAKDKLLDRALEAVVAADNNALALQLGELGELALLQGDLGMAEVYLSEALELYEEAGDELKVAGIHMQKGRLHLFARKRARQASDAYDQLLISRWKISQSRFLEAEIPLKQVVEENLALHRYGAAASAYETLLSGYSQNSMIEQAHQSGIEAIKLHAASGNEHQVNRLLGKMQQQGFTEIQSEQLQAELEPYYRAYDASVQAIGAARDYAQLYNHLSATGDALQAWRFRKKAEQSLSNANKRAQYRRQPDVLVELYRSNSSMDSALVSLQKASDVYSRYGLDDAVEQSQQLRAQIH